MDAMSWTSIAGASLASDAMTTLVASAQSPTFAARARGRPPSSFRRYSLRTSMFRSNSKETFGRYLRINHTNIQSTVACNYPLKLFWYRHPFVWGNGRESKSLVLWHLQLGFVDLLSRAPNLPWRPQKRRRRTMNHFLQVSNSGGEEDTSRENHLHY
jgi:hypothetical protein